MCGIAGFVGRGDARTLARMSAALRHRGPDAEGDFHDPDRAVSLAVRRLAVVDRDHAAQPMRAQDDSLVILFNGEIYNHAELRRTLQETGARFVSDHSDTEVLLHAYRAWGPELTARLNGMWAFAIYDRCRQTIFLSRDRFGQKPLFYAAGTDTFAFASELHALLQHEAVDRSVSSLSVQKYFAYGFIPAPHSLYRHVAKLPAGCNLTLDVRTLDYAVRRYWEYSLELQEPSAPDERFERESAERLRGLLRQALRRQVSSDVPVGVFLSGGLDSSAIAYFALEEIRGPLPTFSIGFDHPDFDESDRARRVAALLGTQHTVEPLSSGLAQQLAPAIASRLDEPIGDSSLICTYLLCQIARRSVTVALGGEGADELFGGYDPFRALNLARAYARLVPKPVHRAIRLAAARLPDGAGYMPWQYRLNRALGGLSYAPALWNPVWIGPLEPAELHECFEDYAGLEAVYSEAIELWDSCRQTDLVSKTTEFFVKLYFQDDILAKVDRAGMMNSLEVRSPFLDLDLVDFVRTLPASFRLRRGRTKYLFKEAMRSLLPGWIVDQPKHGFAVPMAQWLREDWFAPAVAAPDGHMRADFARRKLTSHRSGRENNAVFLWSQWLLARTADAHSRL